MANATVTKKARKVTQRKTTEKLLKLNQFLTPVCLMCGKNGNQNYFYNTFNHTYEFNSNKIPYCKECIQQLYEGYYKKTGDTETAMYYLCRKLDIYFAKSIFEGAILE